MNKFRIIAVAATCAIPLLGFSPLAYAATAHNVQTGQNNKNVDSPGAPMAQPMTMKHIKKKHMKKM